MNSYQKKTISILGSCVTRDIFDYGDNDFIINPYIARSTLVSCVSEPIYLPQLDVLDMSTWKDRMTYNDIVKGTFDSLHESTSEWLIIDFIDERFELLKVENSYLTLSLRTEEFVRMIGIFDPSKKVAPHDIPKEMLKKCIERYSEKILEIYNSNKVIIYEAFFVDRFLDKDGKVRKFDSKYDWYFDILNPYLESLYIEIEKKIPKCHVVKQKDFMANENHKWGLAPMHYVDENYQYNLKQIIDIVSIGNKERK